MQLSASGYRPVEWSARGGEHSEPAGTASCSRYDVPAPDPVLGNDSAEKVKVERAKRDMADGRVPLTPAMRFAAAGDPPYSEGRLKLWHSGRGQQQCEAAPVAHSVCYIRGQATGV